MTKNTNWVDKECKATIYMTPDRILTPVKNFFGGQIPLDPATEISNPTGAKEFYTIETNGLTKDWDKPFFVNPPYGRAIREFCTKIHLETTENERVGLALMPCGARFGTIYWQKEIMNKNCNAICFVKGRVKFLRPDGTVAKSNPYDSAIYGYNVDKETFKTCFEGLGKILFTDFVN